MSVHEPLRSLRGRGGVSQSELARRLGISQPAVSQAESEQASGQRGVMLDTLLDAADALGLELRIQVRPKGA